MALTQANRRIRLKTPLGEDELVLASFSGQEAISELFDFEVVALSEDNEIDLPPLLGKKFTVTIDLVQGGKRHFNGVVVEAQHLGIDGDFAQYGFRLRPWLWMLTRYTNCRIFQDMGADEIIEQVMRDRGYTDFKLSLSGSPAKREYCVQYRETDYNFITRLMEEEGLSYHFSHSESSHELKLLSAGSSREEFPAYEQVPYAAPMGQIGVRKDHIYSWEASVSLDVGKVVLTDYDFEDPRKDLEALADSGIDGSAALGENYDYPGGYVEKSVGEKYAVVAGDRIVARHRVAEAAGDIEGICPGYQFTLKDFPRPDADGKPYLILRARYTVDMDDYRSGGSSGEDFLCQFSVGHADAPFAPPLRARRRRIDGIQTATVVGPKGEEIYTDKFGRIKVQFHWDREGKNDENSSCWIRVGTPWAGKGWGSLFIPRIGHEVIVDFLEGDPDRPLVIGSVYNGDNKPYWKLPDQKTMSGIQSRSTKEGGQKNFNELSFEDKKGEELFYTHAEKDYSEHVENDRASFIGHDDDWKVVNNRTVEIGIDKGTGDLITKVKNDETREVGKNRNTDVGDNDTLKVGKKELIEAGQQITLKTGQSSIVMKSTGDIEIKGVNIKITANMKLDTQATMTNMKSKMFDLKVDAVAKIKALLVDISADAMAKIKAGIAMIN